MKQMIVVSRHFNFSFKYFALWKSMCLVHGGSDHFVKPKVFIIFALYK